MSTYRTCDGVARRDFLKVGSLAFAGLTLPDILRMQEVAAAPKGGKAKAVILMWMGGGPSHIDTFDPKPDAPSEWRGEFKALSVKGGDFQVSEYLPKMAEMGSKFSVLNSVTHPEGAHERGTTYMMTGYRQIPGFEYPGFGSVVAKEGGWQKNMPPYVAVPGVVADAGPGYLGADGSPFSAGDPGAGNYQVRDIVLPDNVGGDRLSRRREFLAAADTLVRTGKADDPVTGVDNFYNKAYDLITSPTTRKAFDLKQEPEALRNRYGRNSLGQGLLLGRRLIESGVRFVSVSRGGWDNHGGIFNALRRQRLPELDAGFSTLLADLSDRGMLESTMVIWMGEFGRTPRVNMTGGRDHWPKVMSVAMAGGGLKGGVAVGKSNAKGEEPADRPLRPEDIAFTMFEGLGIDPAKIYHTPTGRPIRIAQNGQAIKELI
ncbi:MAG: DUF1501 domain-containing protein [Actinomycetota bacterium]